jgi:hypothetical protein
VGHTVNRDFVRMRLDGRLFLIDTGMLTPVCKGTGAALTFEAPASRWSTATAAATCSPRRPR